MSANFSPTPSSIRRRILSDDTEVFDVRYRNDHGRQQSRTFSTYETAHGFQIELMTIPVQEAEARLDGVLDGTDKLTLAEYLATDVETRTGISEGTRARYRTYINGSILPSFGDRLLAEVGTLEVKRWIARRERRKNYQEPSWLPVERVQERGQRRVALDQPVQGAQVARDTEEGDDVPHSGGVSDVAAVHPVGVAVVRSHASGDRDAVQRGDSASRRRP